MTPYFSRVVLALTVLTLSACDAGLQHMGPTEYGVRFRALPRFLGGGVGGPSSVASPLETVVVMPWEQIIRFETAPQYLSWGRGMPDADGPGGSSAVVQDEDVHTRARDGNEAALKLTVRYRINQNPQSLVRLAQEVGSDADRVRDLVVSSIRCDIRTSMNFLKTSEFRDDKKRNDAVDQARAVSAKRLAGWGVELEDITLKQYRFVRLTGKGSEDTSYQDRLREIQEREQDIEGERSRIDTMKAKKETEYLQAESTYNQRLAEAKGYREQATLGADAYFTSRENEAKAILAEGLAEIEGMKKQLAALSGPGGQQLLKLEVARQLVKGAPRFVALGERKGGALEIGRTDTNQLLQQLGVMDSGVRDATKGPSDGSISVPVASEIAGTIAPLADQAAEGR
jgi:regulator of protease activity HflC (stomatin/prohibitin superfamily)